MPDELLRAEIEAWSDADQDLFILRYPDKSHNDPWKSEWMLVAVCIGIDRGQAECETSVQVGRNLS